MLRYISIFREKYNRHSILFTGFGYKLVTDQTTYNFTHGISIIEQLQLFSLELNYIYYNVNSLVIQSFLSRHVRSREAYCYATRLLKRQSTEKRTGHFLLLGAIIGPIE